MIASRKTRLKTPRRRGAFLDKKARFAQRFKALARGLLEIQFIDFL
jgi:hypothetical protein